MKARKPCGVRKGERGWLRGEHVSAKRTQMLAVFTAAKSRFSTGKWMFRSRQALEMHYVFYQTNPNPQLPYLQ
jgi:hypothetical protein